MSILTPQQPILLVEDVHEDVVIAKRNLLRSGMRNPVQVCETGQLALDYLARCGNLADGRRSSVPGVILLDLSLPDMEGSDVLFCLKQDPVLRSIPVMVMTASRDERDVQNIQEAGADACLVKPVDFTKFFRALQQLKFSCFELVFAPIPHETVGAGSGS